MDLENITVVEACAVLDVTANDLAELTYGPFCPDRAGYLTLKQTFGIGLIAASLAGIASAAHTVAIALKAADEAVAGGERALAVGWKNGEPRACWINVCEVAELRGLVVLLPADRQLATLIQRVTAFRAAALQPN